MAWVERASLPPTAAAAPPATALRRYAQSLGTRVPLLCILGIAQSAIPSIVFTVLFGYKVCDPTPLLLLPLARLAWPWQVVLRLAYVLASGVGLLHAWNITIYTLPFYVRFVTVDTLPWSPGHLAVGLFAVAAFLAPLPAAVGRARPVHVLALAAACAIVFKASPLAEALPRAGAHLRSPALRTGFDFADGIRGAVLDATGRRPAPVAAAATPEHTFDHAVGALPAPPPKLFLMVVESWSETPEGLKAVTSALAGAGVTVRDSGYTPYQGSTLPGELRELCSRYVSLGGFAPGGAATRDCLPSRLRASGYETVAVHGYVPAFYLRGSIWRDLGFEHRYFRDAIAHERVCAGPFPGVCDSDAISWSLDRLAAPGKRLVYLLTLSSHEPVLAPDADRPCGLFAAVPAATPAQTIARQTICHLVRGLRARHDLEGSYVYVVGDHAPPSIAQTALLPHGVVPYLVLSPASAERTAAAH
jgi:hypothetical protein